MKKTITLLSFTVIILSSTQSFARNVWRECGIGGMLFPSTGWAAITSNIIWDWRTTATSSNVSSDDLCEGKKASTAKFINENFDIIEEQTAAGSGEHLNTALNILGCDKQFHDNIIKTVRAGIQTEMSSSEYSDKNQTQKAENYYNVLMQKVETSFAKECHVI